MRIAIYGHGGSQNHGNEAIVRGIRALFPNDELIVYTFSIEADRHFGLDGLGELKAMTSHSVPLGVRLIHYLSRKLKVSCKLYYRRRFKPFIDEINKNTVYLFEAGDQYCELGEHRFYYRFLNNEIRKRGAISVMLGCTVNPGLLLDPKLREDICRYSAVIARESVTFSALQAAGIDAVLAPCPAFAMKAEKPDVPPWIETNRFIGFNVGFLQQGNEVYYNLLMRNYTNAIEYVLSETSFDVALIPHVNWGYEATDYTALDQLYRMFYGSDRVHYVLEHNAPQQKYIISKCKAFVSLRTHATIPALESQVPTLITGYKTKSKGIATDVFTGVFDMLADVQSLSSEYEIRDKLKVIIDREDDIKAYYKKRMPQYLSGLKAIVDTVYNLVEK